MGGLFLFLVFAYFLPSLARYQNPTRQYLIKSVGTGSDSLNADAANFLSGFSRGSHPNRLGKVNTSQINSEGVLVWWSSDSSSGEAKDYFEGIIGISIACIFFASLSLATCCGFCLGRCGWNKLGGRQPTPKTIRYLPKHIYLVTAGIFVVATFMIILFAIALTSNTDVSASEDATLAAVEGFENYLWEYMGPLNSLLNLTTTGLHIAQGMNSLIFSTLPTTATLQTSNQCLTTSYSVFQLQDAVSSDLGTINTLIHSTVNFTVFAALFSQLSSAMAATPNLYTFDTTTKRTNLAIGTLPSLPPMVGWVGDLDTDLDTLTTMTPTINTLDDLRTAVSGLGLTSLINTLSTYETSLTGLPDLQLILDKINDVVPNTQADMQANLTALKNGLAAMPNPTSIGDSLTTLDPLLTQIETDTAVESDLSNIQTVLNDLAFLPSLISSLQTLNNVRATVAANVSFLLTSAIPVNSSFVTIDDLANQLLPLISATQSATDDLTNAISGGIVADMQNLQVNLPTINCLNNVYNQLSAINNSVFILPNSTNPFFQARPTIQAEIVLLANLTADINATANALTDVNNSLSSFPDFSALTTQLQALITAISNAPVGQLITDLGPLNQSLVSLPPLAPIISSLQALSSSRTIPTLSGAITGIQQIGTTLASFPNLAPYISSFYNIGDAKSLIELDIDDAIASVSFTTGDVGAQYKGPLTEEITNLKTNITNEPSIPTLRTSLQTLNSNVNSLPNLTMTVSQLNTVQTNANNVPNVDVLNTNIQLLDSSIPQSTLSDLVTGNPDPLQTAALLFSQDTSLFTTQSAAMTTSQDSLNQYDVDVFLVVTNGSSAWLTANTVSAVSTALNDLTDSRQQLLVFNDTVANLSMAVDGLSNQINNFTDDRYSFDQNKNSVYNQTQSWDLVRLFMAFFLVALPVLILGFGLIASIFKRPCFSMVMALSAFGIIALFFFLAGTQVPLATFMSDQCADPNAFIEAQLTGEQISATDFYGYTGIKVTENVSLLATYDYLFNCIAPRPEFLVLLDDPAKLINDTTEYNFTTLRTDIIAQSGGLVLNPTLYNQFDVLNGLVNEAVVVIGDAMTNLVQCDQIQALQETAIDAVCVQFAGAFALNTCLYALFAICISPALCLGVKGYKMFNPRYRATAEDEERRRNEEKEKEPIAMTKKAIQQTNKQPEGHARNVSHLPPGAIRGEGGAVFIPDSPKRLWVCATCTYHNQPSVVICQVCGTPREEQSGLQSQSLKGPSGDDSGFFIEPVNENPGAIDLGGGAILVPVDHDEHK